MKISASLGSFQVISEPRICTLHSRFPGVHGALESPYLPKNLPPQHPPPQACRSVCCLWRAHVLNAFISSLPGPNAMLRKVQPRSASVRLPQGSGRRVQKAQPQFVENQVLEPASRNVGHHFCNHWPAGEWRTIVSNKKKKCY